MKLVIVAVALVFLAKNVSIGLLVDQNAQIADCLVSLAVFALGDAIGYASATKDTAREIKQVYDEAVKTGRV